MSEREVQIDEVDMERLDVADQASQVCALVDRIRPLFAGTAPEHIGAALADVTAIWLAGHAPAIREILLEHQVDAIRKLVTVNERIIFGGAGHPAGRGSTGSP